MPRDAKGQPFGIDTIVQTPDGPLHVSGFSVSGTPMTREQIRTMAAQSCPAPRVYFWHEVEVIDPESNPWSKHAEHTDMCHVDVAQRDGLQLPAGDQAVRSLLEDFNPLTTGMACKCVWGGVD